MTEEQQLIKSIQEDFKERQSNRKSFEAKWLLSMNFLLGNQYCSIGYANDIEEYDKQFFLARERSLQPHRSNT